MSKCRALALGILGVLGLLLIVFLISGNATAADSGPLHYIGDSELAASPLVTGSGTEADPYVFTDHEFECAGSDYGLWIQGTTSHVRIENCAFLNCTTGAGHAIYLDDVSNADVEGCRFSNCYFGIYAYLSDNCTFHNNDLTSTEGYGIMISGSYWMEAIGNYDTMDYGPRFYGVMITNSAYVAINDTGLSGCTFGIGIYSSTSVMIENANIYGTSAYGFDLSTASDVRITNSTVSDIEESYYAINAYDVSHIDISGNQFSSLEASTHGIYLSNCDNATISNNSIGTTFRSIDVYRCENMTIAGNLCTNSTDYAMHVIMINGQVLNNTVRESRTGLFLQECANVFVSGNQLELMQGEGFDLYQCHGMIVADNYVTFTNSTSFNLHIILSDCTNCQIHNNTALGYGNTAIAVYRSNGLLVAGNYIASISAAGIKLDTVSGAEVLNNTAGTGPEYGLLVLNSYDLHLAGNILEGCAIYGISLEGSYDALVEENDVDLALSRGISVFSGGTYSNITLLNNSCLNTQTGIVVSEIGGVVVEGNDCSFGSNGGIYFSNSVLSYAGNNTAHDCGVGIALDDSPGCVVNGGSFDDCNVGVSIGNDGVSISNVSASSSDIYGLLLNNAPYSYISGSYFNGSPYGIVINLDESHDQPVYITDCFIENNTDTGLMAHGGIFSEISGNHFAYNVGYGAYLDTTCESWFFFNNTFLENNHAWGINPDAYQAYDRGVNNHWYYYQGDRDYGNGWSNLPNVDRDPLDGYVDYPVWIGGSYQPYQYQMPYGPKIESPSAPTGMTGVIDLPFIWLNWTEPGFGGNSTVANYEVYQGFAPDSLSMIGYSYGELFYPVNYDLMNGMVYYFAVKAVNLYDFVSEFSDVVEVNYTIYPQSNFSPIVIHSDQEFAEAKIAHGWSGDGSVGSPYIIEGLIIDGSGWEVCIEIWHTTVHFVVRNCTFYFGYLGMSGNGIELLDVVNGQFLNCTFAGDMMAGINSESSQFMVEECEFIGPVNMAVMVQTGFDVLIANSTFNGSNTCIALYTTTGVTVLGNTFLNFYSGVYGLDAQDLVVRGNLATGEYFLDLSSVTGLLIEENSGADLEMFSRLYNAHEATVRNNTATGTGGSGGLVVDNAHTALIEGNRFSGFIVGVQVRNSDIVRITGNIIDNNDLGMYLDFLTDCQIDNNNISANHLYGMQLGDFITGLFVLNNLFADNYGYGVYVGTETYASFSLNMFQGNNGNDGTYSPETLQAFDKYFTCDWSLEGYGNHWAEWTAPDADGDGIVDDPYGDGEATLDYAPLAYAFGIPTELTATVGPDFVNLSWGELNYDFSEGIDGYYVYRGLTSDEMVMIGTTSASWYNDTAVSLGVEYYYSVSAYAGSEEGAPSDWISAIPCDVPGAPTGLTVVAGLHSFQLSWTAPAEDGGSPILGYAIWRGDSPITLAAYDTVGTNTAYTDLLVGDNETWYYAVAAFNQAGDGEISGIVGNTTFGYASAPLNVTTQFGNGNVTVSWDAPLDDGGTPITGYVIEYVHALIGNLAYPGAEDRSWLITGLTNGWEYSFRVQAVNMVGDGAWSPAVFDTPATVPGVPGDVASVSATGAVSLSWLPPADDGGSAPTLYRIYRMELDGDWVWIGNSTLLTYEDDDVSEGVVYLYSVSAVNKAGEGNASEPVRAVLGLPSPPMNLIASNSAGKVQLNWTAPAGDGGYDILGYKIYRDGGSGFVYLDLVDPDSLGHLDTTATPGVEYRYRVTAVSANGEGSPSDEASITLPLVPPEAPVIDSAVQEASGVVIVWHVPESSTVPDEFLVYRGEAPDSLALIAIIDGDVREYLDVSGTNGMFYALRSSNEYGIGEMSDAFQATPGTVPGAVQNLTLIEGEAVITLNWDAPADDGGSAVLGYRVFRELNGTVTMLATVSAMTFTDHDVVGGLLHEYWIVAMNAYGAGPESIRVNATPEDIDVEGLPAPAYLLATVGNGTVTLTWDPMASFDVDGFRVFRSDGGNFTFLVAQPGSTYTDTGLVNGETYTYRVQCFIGTSTGENASVDAMPGKAPEAPTLNGQVAVDRITLGWSVPENGGSAIIGYRLYRTPGTGTTVLLASLIGTGYIDTSVLTGVNYTYMVTALNAFGEGSPSNTIVLRTTTQPSPSVDVPAEPYLSSATGGNTSISLLWNVPSDTGDGPISGYNVYRGTSALSAQLLVSVPAGTTTYVDGTVVYGTTYYYWVSALNQWGESEPSRMLSATLIVLAVPGEVDVDVDEGQGRITLNWDVPDEGSSSVTEYRIYRRGETGDRQLIATVPAGTDTFVDGSVEAGVEYDYWVTAVNAAGEGPLADAPVSGVPLAIIAGEAEIGPLPMIALALGAVGLLIAIVAVVLVLRKK